MKRFYPKIGVSVILLSLVLANGCATTDERIAAINGRNSPPNSMYYSSDQQYFAKCAAFAWPKAVRMAAIQKLNDQEWLVKVVTFGDYPDTRRMAAARLTNQSVLENLSLNDKDAEVRLSALQRLKDLKSDP